MPPRLRLTFPDDAYETLTRVMRQSKDGRVRRRAAVLRAVVLGRSLHEAATSAERSKRTLLKWAKRFIERGIDGLADQPRSGRAQKKRIAEALVERLRTETPHAREQRRQRWRNRPLSALLTHPAHAERYAKALRWMR